MSLPPRLPCAVASGGPERVGVIDMGSNSVRLVVYQAGHRVPIPVFNEKVLCGLGGKLASTGLLDPEGVERALAAARRFTVLAREMGVERLDMVATAAVRDARDGPAFVARVLAECGYQPRVLSGEDEARLAGYGVLTGFPEANGLVGDLGGGSLELVAVGDGRLGTCATLPLGPLQLLDRSGGNARAAAAFIAERLADQRWIEAHRGHRFYAVGGAWRALAKLHMSHSGYGLRILHYYIAGGRNFRSFARLIAARGGISLTSFRRVPAKRAAVLPFAALTLACLLDKLRPREIVFSALGLREGLLYAQLPEAVRDLDPLIEECRARAREQGRFSEHGHELFNWIGPLFMSESTAERRLRLAICLLSDIGWRGHPDYRAELTFDQIMDGQFIGLDHPGRALMALALFVCYGGGVEGRGVARARRLLDARRITLAQRIGVALRLGQRISGGTAGLLQKCRLSAADGELVLIVPSGKAHLAGEVVARRLDALGRTLSLDTRIELASL